jgi:nitrogen regulatory protein PII
MPRRAWAWDPAPSLGDLHPQARGLDPAPVKQIVAIVKPYLAEKVLESLKLAPLEALSVREVKGYGRQKSYLDQYGDSEYTLAFLPKVEIALWVEDFRVEDTVKRIVAVARTGRMGDGKIFVLPVAGNVDVIDVATGEAAARKPAAKAKRKSS